MFKKILIMELACVLCFAKVPSTVLAGGWEDISETDVSQNEGGYEDRGEESYGDDDEDEACSIGLEDLCVMPAKKIMAKGSTFKIKVAMREGSIFENLSDEEWDAVYEHDVANVEFKSSRPSVAKVNSVTGKVRAKKAGSCRITTTIYLIDGTTVPLRTTVLVSK